MAASVRVLYLYAEVMGYTMATIRALVVSGAEVHVVHWDSRKLTPVQFQATSTPHVTTYARSNYTARGLIDLARRIAPDIAVVSGWQDKAYLPAALYLRQKGIPVVVAFDDQWHASLRQRIASGFAFTLQWCFSHAWVSGPYQFEYARRLGFERRRIVFDLYSCDLSSFNKVYDESRTLKMASYPHRFLYVGRFHEEKGVDILVSAWRRLQGKRGDWQLHMVGSGPLDDYLSREPDITVSAYLPPNELRHVFGAAGCFILPSRRDQWGVAVHEATAAGLPMICTSACGAGAVFLIEGLNGLTFTSEDPESLASQMHRIINTPDAALLEMSRHAHQLAQRITPESSAASLRSVGARPSLGMRAT